MGQPILKVLWTSGALIWFGLSGCSKDQPGEPAAEAALASAKGDAKSSAKQTAPVDKSIPRLVPRPVVWIEDLPEDAGLTPARQLAKKLSDQADMFKSLGQNAKAEPLYRQAEQMDPTWSYPSYQAACNYALSEQLEKAEKQLDKAFQRGFDDFAMMVADNDLENIRTRPRFNELLQQARVRYVKGAQARVGQPIAVRPAGQRPARGWPLMLLLHGYGDTNLSYLDHAELWADLGFLSVAVPGSLPSGNGFIWSLDSTAQTHSDLEAIVKSPLLAKEIDPQRVYMLGFSQGAQHAMLVMADHTQAYAGAVVLSPGGSLAAKMIAFTIEPGQRPAKLCLVTGEREGYDAVIPRWQKVSENARWKFRSITHPGGHQFPEDWADQMPQVAEFLLR
jgi:predicted esterase